MGQNGIRSVQPNLLCLAVIVILYSFSAGLGLVER